MAERSYTVQKNIALRAEVERLAKENEELRKELSKLKEKKTEK